MTEPVIFITILEVLGSFHIKSNTYMIDEELNTLISYPIIQNVSYYNLQETL
jgi:hypothetical protein